MDDLLVRVDAQVSEFNAAFGSATKSTLQLEAALAKASAQQAAYQDQLAKYGAEDAATQKALAKAQMSNAALAEKQAAIQAKAAAEQRAAMQAQATAYSKLGRTYATVGGGIALALGLSAKAAIDWQDQFARVRQALEGTPQQLSQVEQGLLGLSKTLPTSTSDLADMAQSAAQTGVATGDIVSFTKVVAELATTAPDLQDGATQLARFLNVTGTSTSQVENVASAMTKLGQAGASTVSEISDLGLRLAGAGRTAELSNGEILGFANAMTSLGLRVETAGTNFSKTLLTINTAVSQGGESLKGFADVAGTSSAQFAKAYGQDSSQAIVTFLAGLDRIRKSGGDVSTTLAGLGITSQRQVDVLNRLSQNTDLVTKSLQTGNQAYAENTALQETFGKQAETTASQLQIASNNIHVLAIGLGNELLPVLGDGANLLSEMAQAVGSLPGPLTKVVVVLGTAAAATTLFSGATLLMKARLLEARLALEAEGVAVGQFSRSALLGRTAIGALGIGLLTFGANAGKSNDVVGTLTETLGGAATGFSVGGPWGAAIGGAIGLFHGIFTSAHDAAGAVLDLNKESQSLAQTLSSSGDLTKSSFEQIATALQTIGADTQSIDLGIPFRDLVGAAADVPGALDKVNAQIDQALKNAQDSVAAQQAAIVAAANSGQAVSQQQRDDLSAAQALLARLQSDADGVRAAIGGQNQAVNDATQAWKDHASAEGAASGAAKELAGSSKGAADGVNALADAQKAADAATKRLAADLQHLSDILSNRSSVRDYEAALDAARKASKSNADITRENTDEQRKAQAAFDAVATSAIAHANAMEKAGKSTADQRKFLQGARNDLIDLARKFNTGDQSARDYAGSILHIPRLASTRIETPGADESLQKVNAVRSALDLVNGMTASATVTITAILNTAVNQQAAASARDGTAHKATGGPIFGPGTSTSDSIPARLSNGEFVINARAAHQLGLPLLMRENALGLATGGPVGFASGGPALLPTRSPRDGGGDGGNGGLLSLRELLKLLARPEVPITLKRVNALYRDREAEERKLEPLLRAAKKAHEDEKAAQKELNKLQNDDAASKKEVAAAQKKLNEATKDATKADKAAADQRDALKEATDKWREAQRQLIDDMKASVEQTLSLSSAFGGEGSSLSAQGLLAKKRAGAADTKEFTRDLRIIQRKGADKDLIAELKAEGPSQDALTLLRDLIRQPRSYFKAEARADAADRSSARQLATYGVHGGHGKGGGDNIGTQNNIGRQAVVHIHGAHVGPTLRQIKKTVRDAATHGLMIAGAP